jgi:hypothetical protein
MGNNSCICANRNVNEGGSEILLKYKLIPILLIQKTWRRTLARKKFIKINFDFFKLQGTIVRDPEIIISTTSGIKLLEEKLGPLECGGGNEKYAHLISLSVVYKDRSLYIGTFNTNFQKEGFGIYYQEDGSKYTGYFKNDTMNGYGRIVFPEGDYYDGEFVNGKFEKYGEYGRLTGLVYKGQWKAGERNGKGTEYRDDGSCYIGDFTSNVKTGQGKYRWAEGDVYEGSVIKNNMEGIGKMVYSDKKVYYGEWKENKMAGKGVFIWPDYRKYIGSYSNDKKNGVGLLIWPNGKRFEGNFMNGKQHGFGIYYSKEITQFGEWRLGKRLRWIDIDEDMKHIFVQINQEIYENIEYLKGKGIEPYSL